MNVLSHPGDFAVPDGSMLDVVQMQGRHQVRVDRSRDSLITDFGRATLDDRYVMPGESYQRLFARVASAYGEDGGGPGGDGAADGENPLDAPAHEMQDGAFEAEGHQGQSEHAGGHDPERGQRHGKKVRRVR